MMTNRDYQAQQTKNKIYDAAILLMQTNGVKQTTIEKICKKANVSVGSFYNYFRSKEEILLSVFESGDRYFADVVVPDIYKLSGREQINRFFWHYSHYIAGKGLDFIKHLYFNNENKSFIDRKRYMHKLLNMILQQQTADGVMKTDLTPDELEDYLFIVARGIVNDWCLHEGEYDLADKTLFLINQLLSAYYERPENGAEPPRG